MNIRALRIWLVMLALTSATYTAQAGFTAFESGQVRPLALSSSGDRVYAVNTPGSHLEIFRSGASGLTLLSSVPVGLEPVAVALRNDGEAWVVNHLSDSITVIDVASSPPRVIRTLLVGDEPRDIVFAGPGRDRAFITTAHRGQNSPYSVDLMPDNPGELITPGIGRADVWVFDAANPGSTAGGTPLTVVTLFGDTPRPLAVSPDGSTVYAGIHHSGNKTTVLHELAVCDGGASAGSCTVDGATAPGGLPAPNVDSTNTPQPEVGIIVRNNGMNWGASGTDWYVSTCRIKTFSPSMQTPTHRLKSMHGTVLAPLFPGSLPTRPLASCMSPTRRRSTRYVSKVPAHRATRPARSSGTIMRRVLPS